MYEICISIPKGNFVRLSLSSFEYLIFIFASICPNALNRRATYVLRFYVDRTVCRCVCTAVQSGKCKQTAARSPLELSKQVFIIIHKRLF